MAARIEVIVVETDANDPSVIGLKAHENTGRYDAFNESWYHHV